MVDIFFSFLFSAQSIQIHHRISIRIPNCDTLLSVNIIEFILTGRNMFDTKSCIPNYFLKINLLTKLCYY